MSTPGIVDVGILTNQAVLYDSTFMIDSVSNIEGSKVFILHGTEDDTVELGK